MAPSHRPIAGPASRAAVLPLLLLALLARPPAARAQATLSGEIAAIGANVLVGGVTAGVVSWLRGGAFATAFGDGATGGALQYAGKRLVTLRVPGAALAGRVVGATGASMVRNGAAGRGLLDLVVLPAGPVTLYWTTHADTGRIAPRLHVGRTIFLVRLLLRDDVRLDAGETFSAGAPIFQAPGRILQGEGGSDLGGLELWGAVLLSDRALMPPLDYSRLLAHERVHILQDDFLNIAWAGPIEDWGLGKVPGGDFVRRHAELGLLYMAIAGAMIHALPYEERPWEVEAHYMEARW